MYLVARKRLLHGMNPTISEPAVSLAALLHPIRTRRGRAAVARIETYLREAA